MAHLTQGEPAALRKLAEQMATTSHAHVPALREKVGTAQAGLRVALCGATATALDRQFTAIDTGLATSAQIDELAAWVVTQTATLLEETQWQQVEAGRRFHHGSALIASGPAYRAQGMAEQQGARADALAALHRWRVESTRAAALLDELTAALPRESRNARYFLDEGVDGVWEALSGFLALLAVANPLRAVPDADGYARDMSQLGEGLAQTFSSPGTAAKSLLDWDTLQTSPTRWLGHLLAAPGSTAKVRSVVGTEMALSATEGGTSVAPLLGHTVVDFPRIGFDSTELVAGDRRPETFSYTELEEYEATLSPAELAEHRESFNYREYFALQDDDAPGRWWTYTDTPEIYLEEDGSAWFVDRHTSAGNNAVGTYSTLDTEGYITVDLIPGTRQEDLDLAYNDSETVFGEAGHTVQGYRGVLKPGDEALEHFITWTDRGMSPTEWARRSEWLRAPMAGFDHGTATSLDGSASFENGALLTFRRFTDEETAALPPTWRDTLRASGDGGPGSTVHVPYGTTDNGSWAELKPNGIVEVVVAEGPGTPSKFAMFDEALYMFSTADAVGYTLTAGSAELAAFNEAIRNGASPGEAALATYPGYMAKENGYGRPSLLTSVPTMPGGDYSTVRLVFRKDLE